MRRGSFQEGTVDYAAVGATQAPDLMGYPPEKSIPAESSWRIGSGEQRFASSVDALLSWSPREGIDPHTACLAHLCFAPFASLLARTGSRVRPIRMRAL